MLNLSQDLSAGIGDNLSSGWIDNTDEKLNLINI